MAELAAIQQALLLVDSEITYPVAVLTDSRAAIQAIQQPNPRHHRALVLNIRHRWGTLTRQGVQISLVWIPGHAQIRGNVRADILAKNVTLANHVMLRLPLPRTAIKQLVKNYVRECVETDHRSQLVANSYSTNWYQLAAEGQPSPVDTHTPRWLSVTVNRLRLGFPCTWETVERRERECQHCDNIPRGALEHYLLDCPGTVALRTDGPEVASLGRTAGAAAIVRHIIDNVDALSEFLQRYPPPR